MAGNNKQQDDKKPSLLSSIANNVKGNIGLIPIIGPLINKEINKLLGGEKQQEDELQAESTNSRDGGGGKDKSKPYIIAVETTVEKHQAQDKDKSLLGSVMDNAKNMVQGTIGSIPIVGPLINSAINSLLQLGNDKEASVKGKENDKKQSNSPKEKSNEGVSIGNLRPDVTPSVNSSKSKENTR